MNEQTKPLRIALIGYGKMGKEIERIALSRGMETTARIDIEAPSLSTEGVRNADVAIHFAVPSSVRSHVQELAALGKPVVLGTTGWAGDRARIQQFVESGSIGLVHASNFSVGVNVLYRLLKQAGELFDRFDEYDASVHEVHHTGKLDAPSGTALTIADVLLKTLRRKKEILAGSPDGSIRPEQLQITSGRLGSVVGIHTVVFDSGADSIEITHTAKNRSGFALGALVAAEWIVGRKGMYSFDDVLADLIHHQG